MIDRPDDPKVDPPAIRSWRWMVAGFVRAGIATIFGLISLLYTAVQMVRSGRGLETYHTFWLVEFNWIGLLILFALLPVAFFVGLFFRLRERREWRSLENKYGPRGPRV